MEVMPKNRVGNNTAGKSWAVANGNRSQVTDNLIQVALQDIFWPDQAVSGKRLRHLAGIIRHLELTRKIGSLSRARPTSTIYRWWALCM